MDDRLAGLVDRLCNKRNPALDGSLLAQIKSLCKLGDDNVIATWQALWGQLRAPHAQTRLLALLVCEQLFQRSRAFRLALLAKLSQVLEAVLGFNSERPLPPPPAAAAELREKALDLVGEWEAQYGAKYKQLQLTRRYLRDTLQYRLPSANSREAAQEAERAARQQRQQQLLRQRFAALIGSSMEGDGNAGGAGEWQEGSVAARQLLTEMLECFAILDEQQEQQQAQQQQAQQQQQQHQHHQHQRQVHVASGEAKAAIAAGVDVCDADGVIAADGMDWEDIAPEDAAAGAAGGSASRQEQQQQAQQEDQQLEGEGLAAYGADESLQPIDPAAGQQGDGGPNRGGGIHGGTAGGDADMEAVLETLAGLYRQLTNRTLPQMQEWVRVLGQVELASAAQEGQRHQLLRAATELKGRLAAAKERCDALDIDLQAILLQRQRRERERRRQEKEWQEGAERDAPAMAAAMQDLFGSSGDDSDNHNDKDKDGGSGRGGDSRGKSGSRRQQTRDKQQSQRQMGDPELSASQRQQGKQDEDDWENPYLSIVDPAAPRPRPNPQQQPQQQQQQQEQEQEQQRSKAAARAAGTTVRREGSLPDEVRRKLAEQAPVLPSGLHTQFWDSSAAPTYVSGHGLEVSNHWGPVDVHRELPQERLDEVFMIPMPTSRQLQAQHLQRQKDQSQQQPRRQQAQQQQGRQQGQQSQKRRQQEQEQGMQQPEQEIDPAGGQAAAGAPAGTAATTTRSPRGAQQHQQQGRQQQHLPVAARQQWPSRQGGGSRAADGAGPSSSAAAAGPGPSDSRAAKRTRREQERAYNEAVIGGAHSEELLARQLQDPEQQQQQQQQQGDGGEAQGQARQRRQAGGRGRKLSVRDRLAQKLLRGRAVAAAVADAAQTESEIRRDKFGNRW